MKKLMRILIVLIIISTSVFKSDACIWVDNGESYRISMFRAEIDALYGYRAFYYTPDLLNEYLPRKNNEDRYANCREWKKLIGSNCKIEDVFKMLYQTEAKEILKAVEDKSIENKYSENSFMVDLSKQNDWFSYFLFAKMNEEYNNQMMKSWDYSGESSSEKFRDEIMKLSKETLGMINNEDVKQRIAYHLIRLYRQSADNYKAIGLYEKYFANATNNSIVKTWAMLHYAEAIYATGNELQANLLYAQIFNLGEEKRIRAYNLFNKKIFNETLEIAKNKDDKAAIWAIKAINTPGPALKYLKNVIKNNPKNKAIALLVMREINKLEDWIFTPSLADNAPSMYPEEFNMWSDNSEQIIHKNKAKDLVYLKEFSNYLQKTMPQLDAELKDYLILANAHLALIARENKKALKLFKKVSDKSANSIVAQKNIEMALYYAYEGKLQSKKTQKELAETFTELEKLAKKNPFYYKQLYSLSLLISKHFIDKKEIVYAGLLNLKSNCYKEKSLESGWYGYYGPIAFFDTYADIKDIDILIELIGSNNKNEFEKYLCNQKLADKKALLDLKGTIALRQGNIQTANDAFSKLPHDYWEETYEFKNYLFQNPFIIPYYKFESENYKFNKADVVKELLDYYNKAKKKPKDAAYSYMKIGNFFYNASYSGNSWMMLSYYSTCCPDYSAYNQSDLSNAQKNYENSFYKSSIALDYYNKAEKLAKDPEVMATILIMSHLCRYYAHRWESVKAKDYDRKFIPLDLKKLYDDYSNTQTFATAKCPTLDHFVGIK